MPTVKLLIKGTVQGVFFRATAKKIADGLHIVGNIKNTPDGNVEVIASGEQTKLNKFIDWCRQGPEKASVAEVNITPLNDEQYKEFTVIRGKG